MFPRSIKSGVSEAPPRPFSFSSFGESLEDQNQRILGLLGARVWSECAGSGLPTVWRFRPEKGCNTWISS